MNWRVGIYRQQIPALKQFFSGRQCTATVAPVAPVASAAPDMPNRSNHPIGGSLEAITSAARRILVVDDNVDSANSLSQVLEMLGHVVRTANDGEAGIAMAAAFLPDVVLMDIGMPRLNGYEAARCIRQQPWGQAMMLVALPGWEQEDDRRSGAQAGFDHHLVKPVQLDELTTLMSVRAADGARL